MELHTGFEPKGTRILVSGKIDEQEVDWCASLETQHAESHYCNLMSILEKAGETSSLTAAAPKET